MILKNYWVSPKILFRDVDLILTVRICFGKLSAMHLLNKFC